MFNVKLIKKNIKKKGENPSTLSQKLNIPISEINNLLNNCGEIDVVNFIKIAKFLELNPENLLDITR